MKSCDNSVCSSKKYRCNGVKKHNKIHPHTKGNNMRGGEFANKKQGKRDIKNIKKRAHSTRECDLENLFATKEELGREHYKNLRAFLHRFESGRDCIC